MKYLLLLALALAAPAAPAQAIGPDEMLRSVASEVLDEIRKDQARKAVDPARVAALVEARVLPLFDFSHMARLAAARSWRLATPEQQRALTEEFRTLLVRTYSNALAQYRDETIVFRQLRPGAPDDEVTVRSEVKQVGKEPIALDYAMQNTAAGWKIYAVKVAGVCLVSNYRDVFAEKVRDGGVEGLIKFLADENRGAASRFNSIKNSFWESSRVVYAMLQNIFRSGRQ